MMRQSLSQFNLCLRPWTNFWVNEENYCVTVCGQSSVTSGENVRLCRFSIVTASLYLNNVFGDICPRLHGIVSVLGALGASRTLFCFVLCEGGGGNARHYCKAYKAQQC